MDGMDDSAVVGKTKMQGVREYEEEMAVDFATYHERPVIVAYNEGGYNRTKVDIGDVLLWLRTNRPDMLRDVVG